MRLKDKNAIITGSGNGIGKATAELFAKEGANVVVADIEEDSAKETVENIKKSGGEADFIKVDTSDLDSVERMVNFSIKKYGDINILVNNAAAFVFGTRASDMHINSLGLDPEKAYEDFGNDAMLKRNGKPIEIAYGALFLASNESSFMTGSEIVIDGGATID